ncbi:LacI family DNA-binding transcriptional regulator [Streptomyces youssoufiensis]
MTTLHDVARHADVSVVTVSHVLHATRPVRPATRGAVLRTVEALGHPPNALARSLVASRTRARPLTGRTPPSRAPLAGAPSP